MVADATTAFFVNKEKPNAPTLRLISKSPEILEALKSAYKENRQLRDRIGELNDYYISHQDIHWWVEPEYAKRHYSGVTQNFQHLTAPEQHLLTNIPCLGEGGTCCGGEFILTRKEVTKANLEDKLYWNPNYEYLCFYNCEDHKGHTTDDYPYNPYG